MIENIPHFFNTDGAFSSALEIYVVAGGD